MVPLKKIDLVYGGFMYASNGVATVLREHKHLSDLYLKYGYRINFFTLEDIKQNSIENTKARYQSTELIPPSWIKRIKFHIRTYARKNSLFSGLLSLRMYLWNPIRIVQFYIKKREGSDIVFFQDIFTSYFFLKRNTNKKTQVIVMLHNSGNIMDAILSDFPLIRNTIWEKIILNIEKFVANQASRIGFVSEIAMGNFNSIHDNRYQHKTFFVYNGITPAYDKLSNSYDKTIEAKYRLCCVANINPRKGQKLIIEALRNIPLDIRGDFHLTIVGDGPDLEGLKITVANESLCEYVRFIGQVSNVSPYLEQANIFIMMSHSEGLPMSIIEAMKFRLPCIVTPVGGIPEMVKDGDNGVFVAPNVSSITNVFMNMDSYKWEEMGNNSYSIFSSYFTTEKMILNYCKEFNSLGN